MMLLAEIKCSHFIRLTFGLCTMFLSVILMYILRRVLIVLLASRRYVGEGNVGYHVMGPTPAFSGNFQEDCAANPVFLRSAV